MGKTRVFGVMTVVSIVSSGLFLLSPFSILMPFLWVSIAEAQNLTNADFSQTCAENFLKRNLWKQHLKDK